MATLTEFVYQWLPLLGRTTAAVAVAAVLMAAVLRVARLRSPTVHRAAWLVVLLIGWSFVRLSFAVPWPTGAVPESGDRTALVSTAPIEEAPIIELTELASQPTASQSTAPLPEPSLDPSVTDDTIHLAIVASTPPDPSLLEMAGATAATDARGVDGWLMVAMLWAWGVAAIVCTWLVGYGVFLWRLPVGMKVDEDWQRQWDELLAAQGVARNVPLRVTSQLGPMLCLTTHGYELIVPQSLWEELVPAAREAILRHELAHLVRYDVWKALAVRMLALPHWFNPFAWWAVRRWDEAAEWACDAAATSHTPATAYAAALVRLMECSSRGTAYGSAASGRSLSGRVRRLLDAQFAKDSPMKKTLLFTIAIFVLSLAVVRVELVADEPAPPAREAVPPLEPPMAKPAAEPGIVIREEPALETPKPSPAVEDLKPRLAQPPQKATGEEQATTSGDKIGAYESPVVTAARRGYVATLAAYDTGTTTIDNLVAWSLRLLQAEQTADRERRTERVETGSGKRLIESRLSAPTALEQRAALESHLERMKKLQKKVKQLYDVGAHGGEAEKLALVDYQVAETERLLQAMQAPPAPAGAAPGIPAPAPVAAPPTSLLLPQAAPARQQPVAAPAAVPSIPALADPATAPVAPDIAPVEVRPAAPAAVYETREIHPPSIGPVPVPVNSTLALTSADPKAKLRYDGKRFADWTEVLRSELSPERRAEAIKALAAFGAHGYGRKAADEIIRLMREYDVRDFTGTTPDSKVVALAIDAFTRLPHDDTREVLQAGLKSDSPNERAFASAAMGWTGVPSSTESFQELLHATQDREPRVREIALRGVLELKPNDPRTIAALRKALKDNEPQVVRTAVNLAASPVAKVDRPGDGPGETISSLELRTNLIPDLIQVVLHGNPNLRASTLLHLSNLAGISDDPPTLLVPWLDKDLEHVQVARALIALRIFRALPKGDRTLLETIIEHEKNAKDDELSEFLLMKALGRIGGKESTGKAVLGPAALLVDQDLDKSLRLAAIAALGRVGAHAQSYIPVLQKAEESADPQVREAAKGALESVRSQGTLRNR